MMSTSRFDLSRLRSVTRFLNGADKPAEDQRPGARVLCVASGKGGTGKSILATNLAVLRARRGERVLLIDFDAGLANAHLLLGLAPRHDFGHVLDGSVSARGAVVEGPAGRGPVSRGGRRPPPAKPHP